MYHCRWRASMNVSSLCLVLLAGALALAAPPTSGKVSVTASASAAEKQAIQRMYQESARQVFLNLTPAQKYQSTERLAERAVLMLLRGGGLRLDTLSHRSTLQRLEVSGDQATAVVRQRLGMRVTDRHTLRSSTYVVDGLYQDALIKERRLSPNPWRTNFSTTIWEKVTKDGRPITVTY